MTPEGYFSNASGCGNETASERPMVRKFIIDSVIYWAIEYHIDGFRFDLMGIHDIQTMNEIRNALDLIDPGILIYGEGWTGGLSPLPDWERAIKPNMVRLDKRIAIFSDDFRDGIKGSVFSAYEKGFISGRDGMEDTIKFGVVGSTYHPQIDYNKVIYYRSPWAKEPTQVINYMSAHDNLTLWDKITLSNLSEAPYDRIKMNLLAAAILFTSQGIPFLQSGEDFLRSKPKNKEGTEFDDNSYRSPDFTNSIKWDMKSTNIGIFCYYKGLIEFRKSHKAFRYSSTSLIQENLRFIEGLEPKLINFLLKETADECQNNIVNTICVGSLAQGER
jgi:pullulanase